MPVEVPRSTIASIPDAQGVVTKHNWLAIDRNFRQIVEPGEFLFQLASLFVMISRHGEDLLTSNPATVFENPGLVPDAEVPQKIKNVIRLHRGIQAFKNCLIHFFDGRKRPTAIADDVGMTQMEISSEPCIWHRLRSSRGPGRPPSATRAAGNQARGLPRPSSVVRTRRQFCISRIPSHVSQTVGIMSWPRLLSWPWPSFGISHRARCRLWSQPHNFHYYLMSIANGQP